MSELRRRVPTQVLRGVDAITLEILIGDLVEKPLGQVDPVNVADLFALYECPDVPVNARRRMSTYQGRISTEIADIPSGPELANAVEEWKAVPADRLPESLRQVFREEADKPKRSFRDRQLLLELIAQWDGIDAEAFVVSKQMPPVAKVRAAPGETAAPRVQKLKSSEPVEASPRKRAPAAKASTAKAQPVEDPKRRAWVREVAYQRLAHAPEQGLMEEVLVVGIKHRARERYPELLRPDILSVLREMAKHGQVRTSAGRWMLQVR